jgi:hypothetical protein
LKRRHAASGSSPVTLIIIAALLCLIVAILVKHFHDIASHRRFLDEIRIDHSAS